VGTIRKPRTGNGAVHITDEALRLYRWAKSIEESGDSEIWESEGGRKREFLNISGALDELLGLQLWDSPLLSENVQRDPVSWPLRQALEEAAMAEEAAGRPRLRRNGNGLSERAKTSESAPARLLGGRGPDDG
jgi:hypothetical protein